MAGTAAPSALVFPVQECVEAYLVAGEPRNVLLLKRTDARGGFWQPVSGRIEAWDPDAGVAARREVFEETGFVVEGKPVDLAWSFAFAGRDGRTWRVHAYGLPLPGIRPPRLSDEHTAFRWLPLREASSWLAFEDNRQALRRLEWLVPAPRPRSGPPARAGRGKGGSGHSPSGP